MLGKRGSSDENPVLDGYRDLAPIGEGGFSQVFSATQNEFEREVAIKILNTGVSDDRERAAFERECRAMGVVSQHPNIVTVYSAAFTARRQPSIVMELYPGGTIAERLKSHGSIPASEVMELGVKICGALQTAHNQGLLHRDIKPNNIFVSKFQQPALGDFGISSFTGEQTITGGSGLTVHFAPPEVLEGEAATQRSDVYSLAATLYTMAAGRKPFESSGEKERMADVAIRILREDPPAIGRGVPAQLENVIRRGMARSPAARFTTAGEFGQALQAAQVAGGLPKTDLLVDVQPVDANMGIDRTVRRPAVNSPFLEPKNKPTAPDDASAGPQSTATVVRPQAKDEVVTPVVEEVEAPAWRKSLAVALPIVLVLAVVGVGYFVTRGGPETIAATTTTTGSVPDDAFLVSIDPPATLLATIEPRKGENVVELEWDPVEEADRYQVEQISGWDERTEAVTEPVLEWPITGIGAACFTVQAINSSGRVSAPSESVCVVTE